MRGIRQTFSMLAAMWASMLAHPLAAQDAPDPCAEEGACRYIAEYVIEDPDGETHRFPVDITLPWIAEGNVLLTPGDAVVVALTEVDGALVPELRRTGEDARQMDLQPGEVLFDFNPFSRGSIVLVAQSNYPEAIEYAALLVDMNAGPSRTSVCTLMPGVPVFETWQQPIYQLALWSFHPAEGYACNIINPEASVSEAK